jgi:hypothetical protein
MISWIAYILVLVLILFWLWKTRLTSNYAIPKQWFIWAFLAKLLVGCVFYWTYTRHYDHERIPPDALRYVMDANKIAELLPEHPEVFAAFLTGFESSDSTYKRVAHQLSGWHSGYLYGLTNDCNTIIRLNVPIALIAHGNYFLHALLFAFMSFIGCLLLYKAFCFSFNPTQQQWLWFALFLTPTITFWTSAPTKEAALMPVFGGLIYWLTLWQRGAIQKRHVAWLLLLIPGGIFIKQYILFAMLPGLIFFILATAFPIQRIRLLWIATICICAIIAQHAHHFFIGGDFLYVLHKKLTDFVNVAHIQNAGSQVYVPNTSTTLEFLVHYPEAFILTYLRPFPWECRSWIYLPFIFENLLTLFLICRAIWTWRQWKPNSSRLMLFAMSTVLLIAAIVGNTVPILGAVIRYRTPGLLLLLALLIGLINFQRPLFRNHIKALEG